ncbi:uncharacterized protein A1O9_11495 [Exophiala aquamarina CBS 119918]|uniref:NmrA-like domain-containing protein n=1 Tax=Exophiala aquamarina CBS 119918 TaxID=1182545 RepID=A0A072P9M3_9EURO|nr:uncharacterized protein A1O9_11495 [Exophiala aquamarina CBS 119918]KEF52255.1 hypothetical protein A1O9_11495 [Exophiala aquamarina CBS 119918]
MERVLVVGATGNIGVSVVIGALKANREVLAIVRNQVAAEKLYHHAGTRTGITTVEADVTTENGVQNVVDRVRAGEFPAFQHVYVSVGAFNPQTPIYKVEFDYYRETMRINSECAFYAYRATIPFLVEQGDANATWTLVTGGAGNQGIGGVTGISQGALYSLAAVACRELQKTNIRFNEAYLDYRVEYDENCEGEVNKWKMKASDYARIYEQILTHKDINACRVITESPRDVQTIRYEKKLAGLNTANSWGQ